MEMNYRAIDDKIRNIENQLVPILSTPLHPDTTESDQNVVEKLNKRLHFVHSLLVAEKASSSEHPTLANFASRVVLLQKATRAWTEGRPLTPTVESGGSTPLSYIESCLTDDDSDDHYSRGEISTAAEFKVYENPEFVGIPDQDDDDDNDYGNGEVNDEDYDYDAEDEVEVADHEGDEEEDIIRAAHQEELQEPEAVKEEIEKEVIAVDYDSGEDDEEPEEGPRKHCCYKIVFWGMIIGMGLISVMVGFPDFPDRHATVVLLTPT